MVTSHLHNKTEERRFLRNKIISNFGLNTSEISNYFQSERISLFLTNKKGTRMSYVKSEEHLQNIINKCISEHFEELDMEQILPMGMYYELEQLNLLDDFTWEMRNNPKVLHEDEYFEWRRKKTTTRNGFSCTGHLYKNLSKEFLVKEEELRGICGIYSFYTESGVCLYVGVSVNLGQRIISSFRERFSNYKKKIFLKYFTTQTRSDAYVLEAIVISKLKPIYNASGKFDDDLTLEINVPEFSEGILCNEEVAQ